jgi:putative flippase GtrA
MTAAPAQSPAARQFARFALVGVSNTTISFVAYVALVRAGVPYGLAAALAFAAGAGNGYVLNRRWTFAARDSTRARARYAAVQLGGLAATDLGLTLLVEGAGLPEIGAYVLVLPSVTVGMFLANRGWTFQTPTAMKTLTLYVGRDCHLCELAREELARLREELAFEVDEIDITGVPELERRYREWLPVIELAGRRLSVYRVEETAVREAVA